MVHTIFNPAPLGTGEQIRRLVRRLWQEPGLFLPNPEVDPMTVARGIAASIFGAGAATEYVVHQAYSYAKTYYDEYKNSDKNQKKVDEMIDNVANIHEESKKRKEPETKDELEHAVDMSLAFTTPEGKPDLPAAIEAARKANKGKKKVRNGGGRDSSFTTPARRKGRDPPVMTPHDAKRPRNGNGRRPAINSLSNRLPEQQAIAAPMAGEGQSGQLGVETQLSPFTDPWTHFPNTENAILHWVRVFMISKYGLSNDATHQSQMYDQNDDTVTAQDTDITNMTTKSVTNLAPNLAAGSAGLWDYHYPFLLQFAMNTPYGILDKYSNTFNTTNGTTTTYSIPTVTATQSGYQPHWLSFFDHKYQYYHQIKCDWELEFNLGSQTDVSSYEKLGSFYIFYRYTNEDEPPVNFSSSLALPANTSGGVSHTVTAGLLGPGVSANSYCPLTPDDYMRMGNWKHVRLDQSATHPARQTIKGTYTSGQCKMDVQTLAADKAGHTDHAEGWIQVKTRPTFNEKLHVIIVADNARYGTSAYAAIGVRMKTSHYIQFKDLDYTYKFPLANNNLQNGDNQYFWTYGNQ